MYIIFFMKFIWWKNKKTESFSSTLYNTFSGFFFHFLLLTRIYIISFIIMCLRFMCAVRRRISALNLAKESKKKVGRKVFCFWSFQFLHFPTFSFFFITHWKIWIWYIFAGLVFESDKFEISFSTALKEKFFFLFEWGVREKRERERKWHKK